MQNKYLFLDRDIELYRDEACGVRSQQFLRLIEQCNGYKNEVLSKEHPKKSTTYMGIAAINLSLLYILTNQKQYLDEAKRWIFTTVDYPHWGNAHLVDVDLSASWILFGLSLSYDWIKNKLSNEERDRFKNKLILQAERIYDYKINNEGNGWPTAYWQNHNWINLTGIATAGYALKNEYTGSTKWINEAKENFENVFDFLADDGSDYEGVVYWRYGVLWLINYAHLLKTTEGIDYFKSSNFLKNTFYYRLYQCAPNFEETMNFGDCHDRRSASSIAMFYKFASEYNDGYAQNLAEKVKGFMFREQYESGIKPGILPEAALEFIWYNPNVKIKEFSDLPLTKYFDDLGLVTMRSSWNKDATMLSFKCGSPGGKKQWEKSWEIFREKGWKTRGLSHQHPDNNSFILFDNYAYNAIDEGYNRTVKACEHNIITIDGKGYENEGNNDVWQKSDIDDIGKIECFYAKDNFTYVLGETAKTYDKSLSLNRFARHVIYTNSGFIIMIDELESSLKHKYTYNFQSDSYPIEIQKDIVEYKNGSSKMKVYSSCSNEYTRHFKDTKVRAIMTTQEPDKFREINMKTMCLENTTPVNNLEFINLFIPEMIFNDYDISADISDNGEYYIIEIKNEKGLKERLLFKKYNNISTDYLSSDAKFVYMSFNNDKLNRLIACNGEKLNYLNQDYKINKSEITDIDL